VGVCEKVFDEGTVNNEERCRNHQNAAHGGDGKILKKFEDEDSWG